MGEKGVGDGLGGVEGRDAMVRMYYMREDSIFNFKKDVVSF